MHHRLCALLLALPILLLACGPSPQTGTSTTRSLALSGPLGQDTTLSLTVPTGDQGSGFTLTPASPVLTVNGAPITGPVTVQPGDTVTVTVAAPTLTPLPAPPPGPLPVAEGEKFSVDGTVSVRYGAGTRWRTRDVSGTGYCSSAWFGGDPAVGVAKHCEVAPPEVIVPPAPVYAAPLVITAGGRYTGNWESTDPLVPSVLVKTAEPVVIENCRVRGAGILIKAPWVGVQLTVRGCIAQGLNPNDPARTPGRFLSAEGFQSVVVERTTIEGTGGIYLNAWNGKGTQPVVVRANVARNLEGRYSDGQGGYSERFYRIQFLQLNSVKAAPNVDIGWNRIENSPYLSHIEDTINLYKSSGTATSPILVHDNLIHGAYGTPPSASYSGGGILLGDGGGAHQRAVGNTVLETSNYGIAVAGGNHMQITGNTVLGTGQLSDGTVLDAPDPDSGIYLRDYQQDPAHIVASVIATGNTVGWGRPKVGRPDARWDTGGAAGTYGPNTRLPAGAVPVTALQDAAAAWASRAVGAGVLLGAP
ncbi:hypothetical protein [uncultured Deinococcus sp.]|uniref:hypothetical protein n=1 Tax=uncultured Deinococcus sp. TaxID=158789 RepID=UPI0025F9BA2F|nr:hypothetical protein [uncultured Deinococcus sp.]